MAELDQVKPGCEPFAAEGSGKNAHIGVVLIHGFTGSPDSTVPWAKYLNGLGYRVNAIRLPGHGTTWEDANTKKLADLRQAANDALNEMSEHCDKVFLCGVSFGGALSMQLAGDHPKEVAGVCLVNPWLRSDGVASWQRHLAPLQRFLPRLTKSLPGVASDIADPTKSEKGYERLPVVLLADALNRTFSDLRTALPNVTAPVQLLLSDTDHVLGANNADLIRKQVTSPVDEVALTRSYHVATLDYDAELIFESSARFIASHS